MTSGLAELQKSKIDKLKLNKYFAHIYIDGIDSDNRIGKEGYFKKIMTEFNLMMDEVLVIGDNEDSEIKVGNKLGMITIQTLRPDVPRSNQANFHIESFSELDGVISRICTK